MHRTNAKLSCDVPLVCAVPVSLVPTTHTDVYQATVFLQNAVVAGNAQADFMHKAGRERNSQRRHTTRDRELPHVMVLVLEIVTSFSGTDVSPDGTSSFTTFPFLGGRFPLFQVADENTFSSLKANGAAVLPPSCTKPSCNLIHLFR